MTELVLTESPGPKKHGEIRVESPLPNTGFTLPEASLTARKAYVVIPVGPIAADAEETVADIGPRLLNTGDVGYGAVPFAGSITKVQLFSVQASATVSLDVNKKAIAGTSFAKISASAGPALTNAQQADATLTTWTVAVAAGDVLEAKVNAGPATASMQVYLLVEITGP